MYNRVFVKDLSKATEAIVGTTPPPGKEAKIASAMFVFEVPNSSLKAAMNSSLPIAELCAKFLEIAVIKRLAASAVFASF